MPQSFSAMYAHIIFSTKHRTLSIQPAWRQRLYDYVGGIVGKERGVLLAAGGMPDHIHLLVSLGRQWSLACLLRDIKAGSSKWIHDTIPEAHDFAWQAGYGAFSVSSSNLDVVKIYIAHQEQHHQPITFQDEFRELLRKHQLSWDERYIWD